MLYPTTLVALLLVLATLAARAVREGSGPAAAVGLGAALGGAWLADQVVLAPMLGLLAWIAIGRAPSGRRRFEAIALAAGAAAVVAAPWIAYRMLVLRTSPVFLSHAQYVLDEARHSDGVVGGHLLRDSTAWGQWHASSLPQLLARELGLLLRRPWEYAHDVGFEFVHFFAPFPDRIQTVNRYTGAFGRWLVAAYFAPVLLLSLAGAGVRRFARADRALLWLVPLSTAAAYAFFFSQMRYRIPVEPELIVLAAGAYAALPVPAPHPAPERSARRARVVLDRIL
jgi:hypothetical protein